jgi:hypothetical protein
MAKKISKGKIIIIVCVGLAIVAMSLFILDANWSSQQKMGAYRSLSMKPAWLRPQETGVPCQCVKYVTNSLFGIDNVVTEGSWLYAQDLANNQYWLNAYNQKLTYKKPNLGLYEQVKSPVTAQAGDVIIMRNDAHVYVKMANGLWDELTYIGSGSGHIGFVISGFYYNQDYSLTTSKNIKLSGLSGWLITMRSANWGTKYDTSGLTYQSLYNNSVNPYSTNAPSFLDPTAGCSNVSESVIFLPTNNPVSFFRLKN